MKLRHRVQHVLRKPPHVIAWKAKQRVLRQLRRFGYWERLTHSLRAQIRAMAIEDLRAAIACAPQLMEPSGLDAAASAISARFPGEVRAIIADAERIARLEFSYLGWTRRFEALPLPWTADWGTGRAWESRYYSDYDYTEPGCPSDVKSCWEPSRFHFAVRLGQAFRLTGDVRYRTRFFELLRDWEAANPLARSINWTSPLEVGIRGINLAAAASFFSDADDGDLRSLLELLAIHGAFLMRNLEYTDVRGNHYVGNLLGLLVMGFLLEGILPEAAVWRRHSESRVPSEILLQFHTDGVNFEKSVAYHRFVTEMFLLCGLLLARAKQPLCDAATARLRLATFFTVAYTRPDGFAPVVGDNDDARALPLGTSSLRDHRHIVATSALLLRNPAPLAEGHRAWAEALWLSGGRTPRTECASPIAYSFPEGGFHIARYDRHFLFFDAGSVGLRSGGCHGHHDMLSFELSLDGVALVIDPGSPAYTGDVEAKNWFRSTAMHNTARIDGMEQGGFDPLRLWHLGAEAVPHGVTYTTTAECTIVEAAHLGYERLNSPVTHRRRVMLHADGKFGGEDVIDGHGEHEVELFFHLASDVSAAADADGYIRMSRTGRSWRFRWSPVNVCAEIIDGDISPSYGVRLPASVLRFRHRGMLPWSFRYQIEEI